MKFLIDAQLPRRMCDWFRSDGCDALHTLDLADGNSTPDAGVCSTADLDARMVVSKDADFVNSHLLLGRPAKLLLISTGNITNRELEQLLVPAIPDILREMQTSTFLELGRSGLVVRG